MAEDNNVGILIDFGFDTCPQTEDVNVPCIKPSKPDIQCSLLDESTTENKEIECTENTDIKELNADTDILDCIKVTDEKTTENKENVPIVNIKKEKKSIFSPGGELELIDDEKFDFDLSITPDRYEEVKKDVVKTEDDEEDDDEVFFGPAVTFKEKCVQVKVKLEMKEKKEEEEFRPLSPLTGEQYAEVFKEATTLALQLEKCSLEEQRKKSSTDDESLLMKLGKLTMHNKVCKNDSVPPICTDVGDNNGLVKSPRSPRRETYVVSLATTNEMPAAVKPQPKDSLMKSKFLTKPTRTLKNGVSMTPQKPSSISMMKQPSNPKVPGKSPTVAKVPGKSPSVPACTAKTGTKESSLPAKRSTLQRQSGIAARSKLMPPGKLAGNGKSLPTHTKPPVAKDKYSPPKRRRLDSVGSDSTASDTSIMNNSLNVSVTKRPPARGLPRPSGLKPPSRHKSSLNSSTSSSSSSSSSMYSLNESKDLGKKTSGLPRASSKLTRPQPMKATIPMLQKGTPTPRKDSKKVLSKIGTPRMSSITSSTPISQDKCVKPKRLLPSSISSTTSTIERCDSTNSTISVFSSTPSTPALNNLSMKRTIATPQSSRRRSNIPTPFKNSAYKSKPNGVTISSPARRRSIQRRKSPNLVAKRQVGANKPVFSPEDIIQQKTSRRELGVALSKPSFSPEDVPQKTTRRELDVSLNKPSFSPEDVTQKTTRRELSDALNKSSFSPKNVPQKTTKSARQDNALRDASEKENKENVEGIKHNSPAIDMLIDFSDSPLKGVSPLQPKNYNQPLIDFGSPQNKENVLI